MRSFLCRITGSSDEQETQPPMSLNTIFISLEWDTIQFVGVDVHFMLFVSSPVSFETSVLFAL